MNVARPFKAGDETRLLPRVASATHERAAANHASLTRRHVLWFNPLPALKGRAKLTRRYAAKIAGMMLPTV